MKTMLRSAAAMLMAMVLLVCAMPMTTFAATMTSVDLLGGEDSLALSYFEGQYLWFDYEPYDAEEAYTIVSADPSIVYVDEYDYAVAVGIGTTTVTLTTESGLTDSAEVTVMPPIPYGNNESRSVLLNEAYPSRTFIYTPETSGWYKIYSEGTVDSRVEIYDADGNWVSSSDDTAETLFGDYNFYCSAKLAGGQEYYLVVGQYIGHTSSAAFTMTVAQTEAPTENGSMAFTDDTIDVCIGDVLEPKYHILPKGSEDAFVEYTVADDGVLTQSQGSIVASTVGSTVLEATTDSGYTDTVNVTVGNVRVLSEDTAYTLNLSEHIVGYTLAFIPSQTATYVFNTSAGSQYADLLDANGEYISYGYGTDGLYMEADLTANEVYIMVLQLDMFGYGAASPDAFEVYATVGKPATSVSIVMPEGVCLKESGDTYYVYKDTPLYFSVEFGEGYGALMTADGYFASSDPTVWDADMFEIVGTGETVITVTTDTGLTDSITLVVVDQTKGDVIPDDEIKLQDAMAIFYHVNEKASLSDTLLPQADINGNSEVDLADAMKVFYYVNEKTDTL